MFIRSSLHGADMFLSIILGGILVNHITTRLFVAFVLILSACKADTRPTTSTDVIEWCTPSADAVEPVVAPDVNKESPPVEYLEDIRTQVMALLPERLQGFSNWRPTSTPEWTVDFAFTFTDFHGNLVRVINGTSGSRSECKIDVALLKEMSRFGGKAAMVEQHHEMQPIALHLRYLGYNFIVPTQTGGGYDVSNTEGEGALTITSRYQVVSVVGVGFVNIMNGYGGSDGTPAPPPTDSAGYLTMATIHELVVHAYNRITKYPRRPQEEFLAQWVEVLLFERLGERRIIKCP